MDAIKMKKGGTGRDTIKAASKRTSALGRGE